MSQLQSHPGDSQESSHFLDSLSSTQSSSRPLDIESQSSNVASVPQGLGLGPGSNQTGTVIAKIEDILESLFDALNTGNEDFSIPFRSRRTATRTQQQTPATDSQDTNDSQQAIRQPRDTVNFPGKTAQEAEKFTRLLSILQLCHKALVSGNIITKRNIFYQDTQLFRTQNVVNDLVDDLAFTLGVGRDALNIVAADKGLIAGAIRFRMADNSIVSCDLNHDATQLPATRSIQEIDFLSSRWLLVIEKEATFRTLSRSQYWRTSSHGQGILVTAKGYPDLATRSLLHLIHQRRPDLPVHCLIDYDPDGIAIFRTYKYGSGSLSHEQHTTIPSIQWLGLKSFDVFRCHRANDSQSRGDGTASWADPNSQALASTVETLVPLTDRDRQRAVGLLGKITDTDYLDHEGVEHVREVQLMLMLNMKAEIQTVDQMGDIAGWLDDRTEMR